MTQKKKVIEIGSTRKAEEWTIKQLLDKYIYEIDFDADYQREKVWSPEDQERLIDSVLLDIDIPKIYLAETGTGEYDCVDGKQRMLALVKFFKPEKNEKKHLTVDYLGKKYTFLELKDKQPAIVKKMYDYKLNFVIYRRAELSDDFIRKIFIRLQLGIRLNSGEILNAHMGTIRNFVFKEIGNNGPFLKNTNLSEKRYSRPFTLAQICLNSFSQHETGKFARARLDDLEVFFESNRDLDNKDENLERIRRVLKIMDSDFGANSIAISSRAIAVSAFLFCEELFSKDRQHLIKDFAKFYVLLLREIKDNAQKIKKFDKPDNTLILEAFQTYVSQATVEVYAIQNRHDFLQKAFEYYLSPSTKGKIIGGR